MFGERQRWNGLLLLMGSAHVAAASVRVYIMLDCGAGPQSLQHIERIQTSVHEPSRGRLLHDMGESMVTRGHRVKGVQQVVLQRRLRLRQ